MATSAASMPHEAAAAMFEGPYAGLAWGARHDKSKAIRVEGGYRLTGTWSFASGGRHTRMLGAHSAVQILDGTPHIRYGRPDDRSFVFLRSQAKIIDDWHVLGLRGTGSDSYSVEDLFVPDAHAPARDVDDERREQGPLYPIGSTLLYASGFCSVTIGIARRMLDTYVTVAKGRHSRASPTAMASNQAIHREVAILEARLSATRAFLHEAVGQVYDASAAGTLDVDRRVRLRARHDLGHERGDRRLDRLLSRRRYHGDLREGALRAPLARRHERQPAPAGHVAARGDGGPPSDRRGERGAVHLMRWERATPVARHGARRARPARIMNHERASRAPHES